MAKEETEGKWERTTEGDRHGYGSQIGVACTLDTKGGERESW